MNIQENIKAYVDGELAAKETEHVMQALDQNQELREEAAFYRLLGGEIQGLAAEPKVTGADAALSRVRQPRFAGWRRSPTMAALALAGVAVLGWTILFPTFAQSKRAATASALAYAAARPMFRAQAVGSSARLESTTTVAGEGGMPGGAGNLDGLAEKKDMAGALAKAQGGYHISTPAQGFNRLSMSPPPKPADTRINRLNSTTGRMVVQNGDIEVAVRDVSEAQSEAMDFARAIGGFATNSSLEARNDGGPPRAEVILRVPVAQFSAAMNYLKRLAEVPADVKSVNVTGEDVTGQYADTNGRLQELRSEEESYLGMLRHTRQLDDVLAVRDRLDDVRQQIRSLEAQTSALRDTSELSTINASFISKTFTQPQPTVSTGKPQSWSSQAWVDASQGMQGAMKTFGTIVIFLFVYSPLWLPVAFAAWLLARKKA